MCNPPPIPDAVVPDVLSNMPVGISSVNTPMSQPKTRQRADVGAYRSNDAFSADSCWSARDFRPYCRATNRFRNVFSGHRAWSVQQTDQRK